MVKCADCGFLTARNLQTRQLEEAEAIFRDKGKPAIIHDKDSLLGMGSRHEGEPLCFAQAYDLRSEFMAHTLKNNPKYTTSDNQSIYAVIHEARKCKCFVSWQQGFTPKEHREMIDRKWEKRQNTIFRIIEIVVIAGITILAVFVGAWITRSNP